MTGGGVESIVASGDALLCTEAFGSREHPAVLLIMGPDGVDAVVADALCARLASAGGFVVR